MVSTTWTESASVQAVVFKRARFWHLRGDGEVMGCAAEGPISRDCAHDIDMAMQEASSLPTRQRLWKIEFYTEIIGYMVCASGKVELDKNVTTDATIFVNPRVIELETLKAKTGHMAAAWWALVEKELPGTARLVLPAGGYLGRDKADLVLVRDGDPTIRVHNFTPST